MEGTEVALLGVKLIFAGVAVLLMATLVLWPLWRRLRTKPEFSIFTPGSSRIPEEEPAELQIPETNTLPGRESILKAARADPQRTAMLVERWLREKK